MPDPYAQVRVLIANRGELAVRIARVARALGMESVLAASAADRDSLAAQEADRVVVIGSAQARESYLNAPRIMHAAIGTHCTALHPGYGFLSEQPTLVDMCAQNGITFVGPTAEAMRRVGDKLSARALARSVSVPMTSGSEEIASTEHALEIASQIGYPVITKASAGGGGRGMVVAGSPAELSISFEKASAAAREAFGDGTLYLERFVERARHIEVQLVGDGEGRVVHFGERDCSLQRRYQKMIEEAPAAILPEPARAQLHQAAVSLLAGIRYRNAGTVEFLYDEPTQQFFFMEVNARLQVEHPVSELVTGVDLVRTQLLLATGRGALPAQAAVRMNGHAIEARIIAEDPNRDFLPSPGRVTRWRPPDGDGIRLDTAVTEGTLIPPYYDSMIAKLIVHGHTRSDAIDRLAGALARFEIEGVATNLRLLKFIVDHPDYRSNRVDTRWLERTLLPAFRAQ
ncbi:MAG: acetyl-CoA carboxylase biotin carboxylase subunit [Gammaproteobacteria bacterium]|nr:acetyl-CoA carboxylase biotin carboxylase subunit [Gammaproteobacteria bacterium]